MTAFSHLMAAVTRADGLLVAPSLGIAMSDSCLADPALTRCPGQLLVSRDGETRWTSMRATAGPAHPRSACCTGTPGR